MLVRLHHLSFVCQLAQLQSSLSFALTSTCETNVLLCLR
jgi:hypothetical protein